MSGKARRLKVEKKLKYSRSKQTPCLKKTTQKFPLPRVVELHFCPHDCMKSSCILKLVLGVSETLKDCKQSGTIYSSVWASMEVIYSCSANISQSHQTERHCRPNWLLDTSKQPLLDCKATPCIVLSLSGRPTRKRYNGLAKSASVWYSATLGSPTIQGPPPRQSSSQESINS